MAEHNLFNYSYASFTNAQPTVQKKVLLHLDKLVIVDLVGAS